jgi:hypothetical protein
MNAATITANPARLSKKAQALVDTAQKRLFSKHGIDLNAMAADTSLSGPALYQRLVTELNASLKKKGNPMQLRVAAPAKAAGAAPVGPPSPDTDTIWITSDYANLLASCTGDRIEQEVLVAEKLLNMVNDDNTALGLTIEASVGIIAVGSAWIAGALALQASIMSAGAVAAVATGALAGSTAYIAAAVAGAQAAALAAGLTSAAAGTASAAAGVAAVSGVTAPGWAGALVSCGIAFATTGPGAIIVAAALLLAAIAILAFVLTRDHNICGLVINNTDQDFALASIYCSEGSMQFFPAVFDESTNPPTRTYQGLPARKTGVDEGVPMGFFGAEANKTGAGSSGFFVLQDSGTATLGFLFSNRLAGYASGVYVAANIDVWKTSAADIYATLYANKVVQMPASNIPGALYNVGACCDSPAGALAYTIYCIQPLVA